MLDHVIWVWPTWAATNQEEEEQFAHAKYDVYVGYGRFPSQISGPYANDLCICVKERISSAKVNDGGDWICRRQNYTIVDLENGLPIDKSACYRQTDGVLEIVGEALVSSVLKDYQWSQTKKLLLDIDEDYFGCWSDVVQLYDIGITQDHLNSVSDLVSLFFCVSTAEEEQLADAVYSSIISLVKTLKTKGCANSNFDGMSKCLRNVEIENFLILNLENILDFLEEQDVLPILCESAPKVNGLFLQSLMHYLMNFSVKQLEALSELGICLDISPPSVYYPSSGKFHVCHGDNVPNKTEVAFFMPDESGISFRAMKLRRLLSSLSKQPDMISICRSVRDGYTPKKFFNFIEKTLLHTINKVFRQTHQSEVHYDKNLLGGQVGWTSREHPFDQSLVEYLGMS